LGTRAHRAKLRQVRAAHAKARGEIAARLAHRVAKGAGRKKATAEEVRWARAAAEAAENPVHIRAEWAQFAVPVAELGEAGFEAHVKALTFTPETAADRRRREARPWLKPKSYKAYEVDGDGWMWVPAEYGYTHWGAATDVRTSDGLPLWPEAVPAEARRPVLELYDKRYFRQKRASKAVRAFWAARVPAGAAWTDLILGCGVGKTCTSIRTAVEEGHRIAVLVHIEKLMDQMVSTFRRMYPALRVGCVHTKDRVEVDPEKYDAVVFMIPTLASWVRRDGVEATRRRIRGDAFGTLIGDEAHHAPAESFMRTLRLFNAARGLWLTATPEREDGLVHELEYLTGPVAFRGERRPGALNAVMVVLPAPGRRGWRRGGGTDFARMQSDSATCPRRNAWIVGLVCQLLDDGRTILLNCNRAESQVPVLARLIHAARAGPDGRIADWRHAEEDFVPPAKFARAWKRLVKRRPDLANGARREGPFMSVVIGNMKEPEALAELATLDGVSTIRLSSKSVERELAKHRLATSRLLVAYQSNFCDGFDGPLIDAAVVSGGNKAEGTAIQSAERVSRVLPGKAMPFVIDLADMLPKDAGAQQRMFVNIQNKRAQIFQVQGFPTAWWKVDEDDILAGTCRPGTWAAIKRKLPATLQEARDFIVERRVEAGMDVSEPVQSWLEVAAARATRRRAKASAKASAQASAGAGAAAGAAAADASSGSEGDLCSDTGLGAGGGSDIDSDSDSLDDEEDLDELDAVVFAK
jgi:hypothetical protein